MLAEQIPAVQRVKTYALTHPDRVADDYAHGFAGRIVVGFSASYGTATASVIIHAGPLSGDDWKIAEPLRTGSETILHIGPSARSRSFEAAADAVANAFRKTPAGKTADIPNGATGWSAVRAWIESHGYRVHDVC